MTSFCFRKSLRLNLLEKKKISGAGLDVFLNEPNVPLRLRQLSNVTLYPHIGSATHETRTKMGMLAVENLIAFSIKSEVSFIWLTTISL